MDSREDSFEVACHNVPNELNRSILLVRVSGEIPLEIDCKLYATRLLERLEQALVAKKTVVTSTPDGVVFDFTCLEYVPSSVLVGLVSSYSGVPTAIIARPSMTDVAWNLAMQCEELAPGTKITFHKTFGEALRSLHASITES